MVSSFSPISLIVSFPSSETDKALFEANAVALFCQFSLTMYRMYLFVNIRLISTRMVTSFSQRPSLCHSFVLSTSNTLLRNPLRLIPRQLRLAFLLASCVVKALWKSLHRTFEDNRVVGSWDWFHSNGVLLSTYSKKMSDMSCLEVKLPTVVNSVTPPFYCQVIRQRPFSVQSDTMVRTSISNHNLLSNAFMIRPRWSFTALESLSVAHIVLVRNGLKWQRDKDTLWVLRFVAS